MVESLSVQAPTDLHPHELQVIKQKAGGTEDSAKWSVKDTFWQREDEAKASKSVGYGVMDIFSNNLRNLWVMGGSKTF